MPVSVPLSLSYASPSGVSEVEEYSDLCSDVRLSPLDNVPGVLVSSFGVVSELTSAVVAFITAVSTYSDSLLPPNNESQI